MVPFFLWSHSGGFPATGRSSRVIDPATAGVGPKLFLLAESNTLWKDPPFSMGKSTRSLAMLNCQRVYL